MAESEGKGTLKQKSRREPDYGLRRLSLFQVQKAELLEIRLQFGEQAAELGNLGAQ